MDDTENVRRHHRTRKPVVRNRTENKIQRDISYMEDKVGVQLVLGPEGVVGTTQRYKT